jgi:hypothetical protein
MMREDTPDRPWQDPIVAEVRAARAALLAAADGDLEVLARRLREEHAASGRAVESLPARPPRGDVEAA